MHHSSRAAALGLLREGPEVQVRGDRVAAPDDDQLALGVVLEVHADLAAVGGGQRLAAGARADGAVEQRRAELVGRSAPPCSRPAPGPSCRRSCRARWLAGRARPWRAAASRRCRAPRPSRCARSGRRPSGRPASAGAARARGVRALGVARHLVAQRAVRRRMVGIALHAHHAAVVPRVTRSAQVSGQSCGQAPRTTRWLETGMASLSHSATRPASAPAGVKRLPSPATLATFSHALPERRRWRSVVRVRSYAHPLQGRDPMKTFNRRQTLGGLAAAASAIALPALAQHDRRIVLGQSAAFSGAAAQLGIQMNRGARLCFDAVHAAGGINGLRIRVAHARRMKIRARQVKANTEAPAHQGRRVRAVRLRRHAHVVGGAAPGQSGQDPVLGGGLFDRRRGAGDRVQPLRFHVRARVTTTRPR